MSISRSIRVTTIGMILLALVLMLGIQYVTARSINPDQFLLRISDLPQGAKIHVQSPLSPGAWTNGFVGKDGSDFVHGYVDGARSDFMVPLVEIEDASGNRSMANTYLANFVYRFADEQSAANEFQRLTDLFSSGPTAAKVSSPDRHSVTIDIGGGADAPSETMRWLFTQRGRFLIVLSMPGPLRSSPADQIKQSITLPVAAQSIEAYNQAVDRLFKTNAAVLQSR